MRGPVIFSLFMVAFGCCAVAGVFAQTDNARDSSKSRINKSNTDKNGVIRWVSLSSIEKEIGTGELAHAIYPKIL